MYLLLIRKRKTSDLLYVQRTQTPSQQSDDGHKLQLGGARKCQQIRAKRRGYNMSDDSDRRAEGFETGRNWSLHNNEGHTAGHKAE